MSDQIYKVDPRTRELNGLRAVSLDAIGLKERADLQEWVIRHPRLLGEELLVLTSEFDRFDSSRRRLDILALDKNGILVIVELKRSAHRTEADLQALRYAAFCSTMTLEDCQRELAEFEDCTQDEAAEKIREFLDTDQLLELNNRPRIILAAGSMDDQELTSCVLWLRGFGVDITCVELAPYQDQDSEEILLVPRVVIPIPEARDFIVSVERKEIVQAQHSKAKSEYGLLWQRVAQEFTGLGTGFSASGRSNQTYMQMGTGHPEVHYEWAVMEKESCISVALHFESKDRQKNLERIGLIEARRDDIEHDVGLKFEVGPWRRKWASAEFRLPYKSGETIDETAREAAEAMQLLIHRTFPIIREHILENSE